MGGVTKQKTRVERSIYKSNHTGLYVVQINRPNKGGQFFKGGLSTIEEARDIRDKFKLANPPQSQVGINNNAIKSGKVQPSNMYNFRKLKEEIRQNSNFYCSRCEED